MGLISGLNPTSVRGTFSDQNKLFASVGAPPRPTLPPSWFNPWPSHQAMHFPSLGHQWIFQVSGFRWPCALPFPWINPLPSVNYVVRWTVCFWLDLGSIPVEVPSPSSPTCALGEPQTSLPRQCHQCITVAWNGGTWHGYHILTGVLLFHRKSWQGYTPGSCPPCCAIIAHTHPRRAPP